ncbi:hypothetical protein MMC22_006690 [Lobaria immixta]|nr:hypothetical protein [Lobaria immixta]
MEVKTRFRKRYEHLSEQSHTSSNFVKPTTRLPAKTLPGCRYKYLGFGIVTLSTGITLIAFTLIIGNIPYWLPSRDSDLYIDYRGLLSNLKESANSCDLTYDNNTMMEKAFTINLRSSMHFTFATAKGVDVMWDLFVGQGGRLLLAWISYIVFMDGLTRLLEASSVSYQLYATMVFDTTSLWSTWSTLKAIFTGHGWRGRAFLAWFFVASIYVLGFPALMSAATGYVSPSTAGLRMPDQTFVSSTSGEIVHCFNITNGALIGLKNETLIFGPSIQDYQSEPRSSLNLTYPMFMTMVEYESNFAHSQRSYGGPLNGTNVTDYGSSDFGPQTQYTTNITLNGTFYKFNNYDPIFDWSRAYCYKNQSLPDNLSSMAYCFPESYFVWGFSSLLLYIICSLQIAWTVGMLIVWLDANINSQLCRTGRTTRGSLRAALDIAEAIREVLGEESCAYQDAEIVCELEKLRVGVQYYATNADGDGVSHIGLSSTRSGPLSLRNDTIYGGSRASRDIS